MGPVECKNVCENPDQGFELSFEDLMKLDNQDSIGTFHTHPKQDANLSYEDYESFLGYPRLTHFIIGKDGVKSYKVIEGKLINVS